MKCASLIGQLPNGEWEAINQGNDIKGLRAEYKEIRKEPKYIKICLMKSDGSVRKTKGAATKKAAEVKAPKAKKTKKAK